MHFFLCFKSTYKIFIGIDVNIAVTIPIIMFKYNSDPYKNIKKYIIIKTFKFI